MSGEITLLLRRYQSGDTDAFSELTHILYPELKALARNRARGSDIGATTLVQETYARYLSSDSVQPSNRGEFFGLAATIMRRIIIDEVRRATADKRDAYQITLDAEKLVTGDSGAEFLLAIDRALDQLNDIDQRQRQVFECRYFAGYTTDETAQMLALSPRTTERLWHDARTWLTSQLA